MLDGWKCLARLVLALIQPLFFNPPLYGLGLQMWQGGDRGYGMGLNGLEFMARHHAQVLGSL